MKNPTRFSIRSFAWLLGTALSVFGAADYSTPYAFTTLAGVSSIGSQDGAGTNARFYSPQGVTTDAVGNIFIVDEGNHTIRKMAPDGTVTTLAGKAGEPGSADGTGSDARFDSPQNIAADATNNLYVTDTGNHTIRKITPDGVVTTLAGLAGVTGSADGTGGAARFDRPRGIAIDITGNLYVTEAGNHSVRKITPAGVVTTFATGFWFPETDDIAAVMSVSYGAIAVDSTGNAYVSSYATRTEQTHAENWADNYVQYVGNVSKIAADGTTTLLWQTCAIRYFDGRISNGCVSALTFDANSQLIAATSYRILRYSFADGTFTTLAGDGTVGGSDGPATAAKLGYSFTLAYDQNGTLYISDAGNNDLRKLSPDSMVSTIAGIALETAANPSDGTAAIARFSNPHGTAVDATGNVYVADSSSHCIRKITSSGVVTTLAGTPGVSGSDDGTGTAARFTHPTGIAVNAAGGLYVADTYNHIIRQVSPTGDVSTIAGTAGQYGHDDGLAGAASFWFPRGVAVDLAGNVFIADTSNDTIRKITPIGNVTTIAGSALQMGSADGTGADARFTVPIGIAVDGNDNVYVTEAPDGPTIARIRKITPAGFVTTFAGGDHGDADGGGTSARFHNPYGITVDATGTLFIADNYNQTIRKVTPEGAVSTIAGLSDAPGSTDGAGRDARFYYPQGIAVDTTGFLYVTSGTTVRKGQLAGAPVIATQPQSKSITVGASVQFSVTASGIPDPTYQWHHGNTAIDGATSNTLSLTSARTSDEGDYTVVVTNSLGSVTSDKATLTVSTTTPPPSSGGGSSGGGGGGAPSTWFVGMLSVLAIARRWHTRTRALHSSG